MARYTPRRIVVILLIFLTLVGVTWGSVMIAAPRVLPHLVQNKLFLVPLLMLASYLLLADALTLDARPSGSSGDGIVRFLAIALKVTGVGTFVVPGVSLLVSMQRPELKGIVLVALFGSGGLFLALLNCDLWYWKSRSPQERERLARARQCSNTSAVGHAQMPLTRAAQETRELSPLLRRVWLAACLVALALPLSACALALLYLDNSDLVTIAGMLAFLGTGGNIGLLLWAPVGTTRTRVRRT